MDAASSVSVPIRGDAAFSLTKGRKKRYRVEFEVADTDGAANLDDVSLLVAAFDGPPQYSELCARQTAGELSVHPSRLPLKKSSLCSLICNLQKERKLARGWGGGWSQWCAERLTKTLAARPTRGKSDTTHAPPTQLALPAPSAVAGAAPQSQNCSATPQQTAGASSDSSSDSSSSSSSSSPSPACRSPQGDVSSIQETRCEACYWKTQYEASLLTIKELRDKNDALQEENKKLESYFYDPNNPSSEDE